MQLYSLVKEFVNFQDNTTKNGFGEIHDNEEPVVKVFVGQDKSTKNDTFETQMETEAQTFDQGETTNDAFDEILDRFENFPKVKVVNSQNPYTKIGNGDIENKDENTVQAFAGQDKTTKNDTFEIQNETEENSDVQIQDFQDKTTKNRSDEVEIGDEAVVKVFVSQNKPSQNDFFETQNENEQNFDVQILDCQDKTTEPFVGQDKTNKIDSFESQNETEQISKVTVSDDQISTTQNSCDQIEGG